MKETSKNQQIENIVEKYKDLFNKLDSYKENKDHLDYTLAGARFTKLTDAEIKELNSKINKNIKDIKKIEDLLDKKSRFFNISVKELLKDMALIMATKYPDKKVYEIFDTKILKSFKTADDFYGPGDTYYCNEFKFGVNVGKKEMTFKIQRTTQSPLYNAFDMILRDEKINLIEIGLINNKEDFDCQELQDYFWGIFKSNIEKEVEELSQKHKAAMKSLDEKYKENLNELFN